MVIPHQISSTSLMLATWVKISSQKINLCIGGAVPWTAQPQDTLLQSSQGKAAPARKKVFANTPASDGYFWGLSWGPSLASSSFPMAVLVWCLADSARAGSCADLLLMVHAFLQPGIKLICFSWLWSCHKRSYCFGIKLLVNVWLIQS